MKDFFNSLKLLIVVVMSLLFVWHAGAAPTAITPVTPSETVNESGFVSSDGTNGNSVYNPAGDVILVIKNETAASAGVATLSVQDSSVTIPGYGPVTKSDIVCTLSAGENCLIGPFPPAFYNDGNSRLQLTYTGDAADDMDVLAIKP